MFAYLLKGITYGLILCILIGPIFFALLQAGIEKGVKTGFALGVGIWLSDFLYIVCVYLGLSWIAEVAALPDFKFYVGTIGGIILIAFGISTLLNNKPVNKTQRIKKTGYLAHAIKGFLINTINPFTVFFWIAMSSEIMTFEPTTMEVILFFTGIFGIIVITDMLKVILAKQISKYLKLSYILTFRKIVGIILFTGGFILIYRTTI